jgi:hypothetical protein
LEEWRGEDLGEAPADFGLFRIERTMRSVQQQLAGDDTSLGTRRLQEKIIADLDALLKQVQKPLLAGQSRASSQAKMGNAAALLERAAANGPTRNSSDKRASAAELTANDYDNLLRRVWGHLPARLRDELQSPRREHFLPKYSKLIEDYYQRLAQQPAE